jgi:hypothetical protein
LVAVNLTRVEDPYALAVLIVVACWLKKDVDLEPKDTVLVDMLEKAFALEARHKSTAKEGKATILMLRQQ